MLDDILIWDRQIFRLLNGLGSPLYDAFWMGVTRIPNWFPLFLLFLVLIVRAFHWKQAVAVCLTLMLLVIGIDELTDLVKVAAGRLRPNNEPELRGMIRVLSSPSDFSFFSGHASFSFALTTAVVLFLRKRFRWVYLFFLWPLLMAFSRIYVGVHYPSDVVTGALMGALLAFLFFRGFRFFSKRYTQ